LHQNPIYGQRNFIYIKLHNGGPDINGHLKIHIAEANPGNTWPASWSLIKDTLLTIQSLSTRIVEIPWDVIEGNGHFCLTAWWISAEDPMNFVVTDNIGYNTRQSNNIIWRNVNIIDMGDAALQAKAVFMLKRSNADTINLSFSEPVNFPKTRFLETGKIIIEPDSKIFNAWKLGGSKSSGVRLISNNRFLITAYPARLNNINLPLHAKGKINVRFEKSTKTIKDKFTFVVTQFKSANTKLHHAGGIAYEIYTYKIPSY